MFVELAGKTHILQKYLTPGLVTTLKDPSLESLFQDIPTIPAHTYPDKLFNLHI